VLSSDSPMPILERWPCWQRGPTGHPNNSEVPDKVVASLGDASDQFVGEDASVGKGGRQDLHLAWDMHLA